LAPEQRRIVVHKNVEAGRASPEGARIAVQLFVRIANHHHRSSDCDFGVQNPAVGMRNPEKLHGAKRPLVERDRISGAIHVDVRDDCVAIALRSVRQFGPPQMDTPIILPAR
jgi:hypothetical protein